MRSVSATKASASSPVRIFREGVLAALPYAEFLLKAAGNQGASQDRYPALYSYLKKSQDIGPAAQDSDRLLDELEGLLRSIRRIRPFEENDFALNEVSLIADRLDNMFKVINFAGWIIGGFAILVGGFGIANIMFVSVTERTREIGLRMSIGGRGADILKQFLVESMLISLLGGAIGVLFGFLIAKVAGKLMGSPVVITTQSVVLAFAVCFVIGVFFGWYPAKKAANLNPIDALRYE